MNRRDALFFFVTLLFSIAVQVSLLPIFMRPPFKPDLLLVMMVFIALRGSFEVGAPTAWILGMLDDVFSGLYLGLNALTFFISFIVIKSVSDRLYTDSAILFVLTVAGVTVAGFTINMLLLIMFTNSPGIIYSMFSDLIPRLLVNSFVASVLTAFPIFDRQVEAK